MSNKIELYSATFTFTNDGDSCDSEMQQLVVKVDDAGGGKFFSIETEKWSFDSLDDLATLLKLVRDTFGEGWEA